ncbi:uncharacterized WD repeat-containing protein all2124-like [Haliotis rubra]|uniref:uncharacterized WD repeat-containing protein all2124-like n=1 Tax=Haliotis rubra TaxID=36100 RepID=UPI001EE51751|nr:uncharacterized WD repeat-containing protein all2124-like [Haliotis rubra]XP_046567490.1 uncharacterized WD repeat-containing protein all2124-like [Haliotis rubra]XP_046567498.1 uncharacterized WD repeat-containing protein all2124-like [Haliotis rubra]
MARRQIESVYKKRLEDALEAGKAMDKGEFTKVEVLKEVKLDATLGGVFAVRYSYDGEMLAVGFRNGAIQLLSSRTGKMIKEIRKTRHGGYAVMCMQFHTKEHHILLASTSEGYVYACNTEDGTHKQVLTEKNNEINCLDFCEDGYNFATSGKDLAVRIYDTKTCQLVNEYDGYDNSKDPSDMKCLGNTQRVFALKYHPEYNDIFLTGGWDNHVKIWDSRSTDGIKRQIWGPHICGDSLDLRGYDILTGSWVAEDALKVWNYTDGKPKKTVKFPGPKGAYLYCAQFCDNNVVLAGGSGTNSAKAINMDTNEVIGEVKMIKPVQALDTTMGGRLFAVAGADDCIKLCAMS